MSFCTYMKIQFVGRFLSFYTNHGSRCRLFLVVPDQTGRFAAIVCRLLTSIMAYSMVWRFLNFVYRAVSWRFWTNHSKWSTYRNDFRCTVLQSAQLLAINQNSVFHNAVVSQCSLLRYLPSSVGVCSSPSFSPCYILSYSTQIASGKVLGMCSGGSTISFAGM